MYDINPNLNPKCQSTEEWIKKMCYMYTMEYYSAKWHHLYVESKIGHKWTYLWNRNRFTDIENRLVVAKGGGRDRVGVLYQQMQTYI